jgi:hypothetical protein
MKEIPFGDVSDGALAPGDWDLEVIAVNDAESASGNPCLDIVFKEVNDEGRHFERIPLIEQSLWKLKRLCAAAGLDVSGNYTTSDLKQDLIGSVLRANIVHQEYDGEMRPRAKSFHPIK